MGMKKILIIDDDELMLEVLQKQLENEGYAVATLQRNEGGIKVIKMFLPDVILLDFYFDNTTSAALAEAVKTDPLTSGIKILFISVDRSLKKSFRQFHGDDYIEKPIPIAKLLKKLRGG